MSTTDDDRDMRGLRRPRRWRRRTRRPSELPRFENPIVPDDTIAGRALVAVVAIMTFLASLTTGAVMLVRAAAGDWQSEVAREVTIQVRPRRAATSRPTSRRAAELARGYPGVADVRAYSREESARLLEPWLGTGLALDDLPVPRIVVVRLDADADARSCANCAAMLAAEVPSASLDDHRGFVDRMRAMAQRGRGRRARGAGAGADRDRAVGGVRDPRRDGGQPHGDRGAAFHRRQERLHRRPFPAPFPACSACKGGAIGGGGALVLFALAEFASRWLPGTAAAQAIHGPVRHVFDRARRLCRGGRRRWC